MKMTIRFALLSAAFGLLSSSAAFAEVDCVKLVQSVKAAITADPSTTLQVVEKETLANPGCACEVVKAAIEGSKADVKLVASIVETASAAAPEQMRLISQCAVAVAPDALTNVQAVLAKLDPNSGETTPAKKDSKDAKTPAPTPQATSNPLDFPGSGMVGAGVGTGVGGKPMVGPSPGGPGGMPVLPFGPPMTVPPVIAPPPVTTP